MVLLHCGSVQGRAQKKYNGCYLQFCIGGSCPPALPLMPDTSILPCVPLVPFKLLPRCWSPEWVSLSKSVCHARAFKRRGLRIPQFLLLTQLWLVFTARSYRDLSWYWSPGLGSLMWGWDPSLLRYPSFYVHHTWLWEQQFPHVYILSSHLCISTPSSLLPIWMNVVSLIP